MSRCFPFPPPTYANKGEALGELIKLQREKEEARSKRKEKKLLKKSRKVYLGGGLTKTHRLVTDDKVKKLDVEKYYHQKSKTDLNAGFPLKSVEESEQLENSDITEEHDQPTCSGSICLVSDSTQSGNKRRRQEDSLSNDGDSQRSVFRIRLPLRKQKEPDTSLGEQNKKIRFSTRSETRIQDSSNLSRVIPSVEKSRSTNAETNTKIEKLTLKPSLPLAARESRETKRASKTSLCVVKPTLKPCQELPLAAGESSETKNASKTSSCVEKLTLKPCLELPLAVRETKKTKSDSKTSSCVDGIPSPDSLYRTLIENWGPPHDLGHTGFDDQEWLFGSKQQSRQESRVHKESNVVSCSRSSTLWPQANTLPEVDIFALPYTVPF